MQVLTDNEMQRFVRATGVVGALLLVAGVLGLGLWAVSLGGLLLVLAGLVVLAAVEGRELDEVPSHAPRERVAAGRTMWADDDGPASVAEPITHPVSAPPPADERAADLIGSSAGAPTEAGPRRNTEPVTPGASPAPAPAAKPTLSPLARLAMALPPNALPERAAPAAPNPTPVPASAPSTQERPAVGGAGEGPAVVTFRLPRSVGAQVAAVVGEFNGWSPDADPMEAEDADFVARIALEPGRTYRFRYLLDGERWENDWSADGYVPNVFGGDDSVIDLRR